MKIELELSTPVFGKRGEPVHAISMRAPTGAEILEHGFPYTFRRDSKTREIIEQINTREAFALIAACAGLPEAAMRQMAAVDVTCCIETLNLFFHFALRKPSLPDTSAPAAEAETAASSSA